MINPFQLSVPFSYPLKTPENQMLLSLFQKVYKWNIELKWINRKILFLKLERCFLTVIVCKYPTLTIWLYSRVSNRGDTPLINYSIFLSPSPTLFSTPRLLIHVHNRQRQREAQVKLQNCLMYMFFNKHDVYKHIQVQVWK